MHIFVLYFKMLRGHNNIKYGDLGNFLYQNGIYPKNYNVITFRGNRKYQKYVQWDDKQDALTPSTAIF